MCVPWLSYKFKKMLQPQGSTRNPFPHRSTYIHRLYRVQRIFLSIGLLNSLGKTVRCSERWSQLDSMNFSHWYKWPEWGRRAWGWWLPDTINDTVAMTRWIRYHYLDNGGVVFGCGYTHWLTSCAHTHLSFLHLVGARFLFCCRREIPRWWWQYRHVDTEFQVQILRAVLYCTVRM